MVDVIIVAFNSGDALKACLEALPAAAGGEALRITVVDNASDPEASLLIDESGVSATVIRLDENTGYAEGNNRAIDMALNATVKSDAFLILNPDVVLPPESIAALRRILGKHDTVGAISPGVGSAELAVGLSRSLWGLSSPLRRVDEFNFLVSRLPGCCMLVKPEMFRQVGLFDPGYFLYWEEVDLCLRAQRRGWGLLLTDEVAMRHSNEQETSVKRHRVFYMWRNQVRFAFRNYGILLGSLFLGRRLLIANVREVVNFIRTGNRGLITVALAGLWAGIRGETGRSNSRYAVPHEGPATDIPEPFVARPV